MPILPDALFRQAATSPEAPWLFYAEGLDWRWLSWSEAARRVTAGAEAFASLPGGTRVTFPYRPTPEALLHDLAIQAAGGVPVPRPGEGELDWSDEDLRDAIEAIAREVAPAGPPAGGREILVSSRSLAEVEERAVLAWALTAGAALVLEPDPLSFVPTAAWARPTFFHGTAADLAALRRLADIPQGPLARLLRRPPGLPFDRLRVVLYLDKEGRPSALSPDDEAFWRGRGVRVGRLSTS